MAVLLTYNKSDVPSKVKIDYLTFNVRPYVPYVIRCLNCQAFGHKAAQCRHKDPVCPTCAGKHSFNNCPNRDRPICRNCSGSHSAAFRDCPAFLQVKTTLDVAAKNGISYRDALVQVRPRTDNTTRTNTVEPRPQLQERAVHQSTAVITATRDSANTESLVANSLRTEPEPSQSQATVAEPPTQMDLGNGANNREATNINVSVADFLYFLSQLLKLFEKRDIDDDVRKERVMQAAATTLGVTPADFNNMFNNKTDN